MEDYVMERKRLTPTIVGKIASKHFIIVVVVVAEDMREKGLCREDTWDR